MEKRNTGCLFLVRKRTVFLIMFILFMMPNRSGGNDLPMIDAHSQADQHIGFDEIIELMDKVEVSRTILTLRGQRLPEELVTFASRHPNRITPAVRTKGIMDRPKEKFMSVFKKQMGMPQFGALGEVLMWHAEKPKASVVRGDGTIGAPPKVVYPPDHPRIQFLLAETMKRGWPFVAHIEFTNIPDTTERQQFMAKFEELLRQHPSHPFLLNNLGYLDANDVKRLIEEHPNIYFIPSWTNPVALKIDTGQPFVNMFKRKSLAPEWRELFVRHSDRFVFGLDIVMAGHWRKFYVPQIKVWRKALKELPDAAAHAVAHRNAERLWRFPPAQLPVR